MSQNIELPIFHISLSFFLLYLKRRYILGTDKNIFVQLVFVPPALPLKLYIIN